MERVIRIFSTNIRKVLNSTAETWADLQNELRNEGVSYSGMKAISSINKTTLEHPDAILPGGDFTLYLTPMRTKSGEDSISSKIGDIMGRILFVETTIKSIYMDLSTVFSMASKHEMGNSYSSDDPEWKNYEQEYQRIVDEMQSENIEEDDMF